MDLKVDIIRHEWTALRKSYLLQFCIFGRLANGITLFLRLKDTGVNIIRNGLVLSQHAILKSMTRLYCNFCSVKHSAPT